MADDIIRGRCHCGNIGFAFAWPADRPRIPVRACTCDFCRNHGGRWTSNPAGSFRMTVADERRHNVYRFGTRTADFHVCATCGVVPIVTCELDGRRYAVVNINTFVGIDAARLDVQPISFENEGEETRLARRARNWTPEAA